jgi:hypothetical protein
MIDLLLFLYPIAVRFTRPGIGAKIIYFIPCSLALLVDCLGNFTTLRLIGGAPQSGEWTFSTKLKRVQHETSPAQPFTQALVAELNRLSYPIVHIDPGTTTEPLPTLPTI